MKLYEVLSLRSLLMRLKTEKLPIKTAYKLMKLVEFFESEGKFYQDEFNSIIEKYGEKGEDGNYQLTNDGSAIKIIEGKETECQSALDALQNVECAAPSIKFDLEEFDGVEVTLDELAILKPFIEE